MTTAWCIGASRAAMVTLNRIVALAMAHGPDEALAELAEAARDPALTGHHRLAAVRAHLLELTGEHAAAREQYRLAAQLTLNLPERDYLLARSAGPGTQRGEDD